jgi:hypothetical protein
MSSTTTFIYGGQFRRRVSLKDSRRKMPEHWTGVSKLAQSTERRKSDLPIQ